MTQALCDDELDTLCVSVRDVIRLLTEERERSNAQVGELYAEIEELRRRLRAARGTDDPRERERAPATH